MYAQNHFCSVKVAENLAAHSVDRIFIFVLCLFVILVVSRFGFGFYSGLLAIAYY